eukprot:10372036-Ditylum_brightwellii.AAC.1
MAQVVEVDGTDVTTAQEIESPPTHVTHSSRGRGTSAVTSKSQITEEQAMLITRGTLTASYICNKSEEQSVTKDHGFSNNITLDQAIMTHCGVTDRKDL